MYEDLSGKQVKIISFIKSFIQSNGYPPSVREIASSLDIPSTSTVHYNINILEEKGYLRKDPSKNRALEIIEDLEEAEYSEFQKKKTVDIPVLGKVAAGMPIFASEYIEDTFPVKADLARHGNLFMLKVTGESMIEAGILDGDTILVLEQSTANNGDIVVALLEDSATVKRFYKKDDHVILKPENSTMEPIIAHDLTILGKVIGLYREL